MKYLQPHRVEDVLAELVEPSTRLIGGGVGLVPMISRGLCTARRLVSLGSVDEFKRIDFDDGQIRIWAGVTHAQAAGDPAVRVSLPGAAVVFAQVGNPRVRNWGTVGGNIAQAEPAHDLPVLFAACGAVATIVSSYDTQQLPVEDLVRAPGRTVLDRTEVLTCISVKPLSAAERFAHVRFSPTTLDAHPTATVAMRLRLNDDEQVADARVAVGAPAGRPQVLTEAATLLVDAQIHPSSRRFDGVRLAFQNAVQTAVDPIADWRGSVAYKRHVAGVVAGRALNACLMDTRG